MSEQEGGGALTELIALEEEEDEKEEGRQGKTNDEFYEELFNAVIAHKKFNKLNNIKE